MPSEIVEPEAPRDASLEAQFGGGLLAPLTGIWIAGRRGLPAHCGAGGTERRDPGGAVWRWF